MIKTVPTKLVPAETIQSKTISTKTIPANFSEKKVTCKTENFSILLTFLLITISLLMIVCIYCYLIKNWSKQEHGLLYYCIINVIKKLIIN